MGSPALAKTYGPKTKYLMLAFLCLFVFLVNGFSITAFNLLLATVAQDLGWSPAERAVVATAYSTGMVWFVFVGGIVADRLNLKRMLGGLLLATGIILALRGFVTGVTPYYIIMFIFGILHAFAIPLANKIIPMWFGSKNLALANGIMTSCNPLGQITANLGGGYIIAFLGGRWQNLFLLQGILVALLAVCIFIFAKNRSNLDAELSSSQIQSQKDVGLWKNIKEVFKVPQAWLYIIANTFVIGIIYGGSTQFYTVVQVDPKWALTMAQAGQITAYNNFASMIMYTVFPLIIGKFLAKSYERNYRVIAIVCGFLVALVSSYGIRSYSVAIISTCYFITGFLFGQFVPSTKVLMLKLPQISGPRAGTALGLYYTFERVGQTVFSAVIGASMVGEAIDPASTLSSIYLLYAVAPVLMIIAMLIDRAQAKKRGAPPPAEAPAS